MRLKTSKGKKVTYSLICVLCFCAFSWLRLCSFGAFCAKSFRKKEFKTVLTTSFILLLNLSYYKHEFFLITIFFNCQNLFQLSQSFLSQHTNSSSNTSLLSSKHDKDILSISSVPNLCFLL